MNTHVRNRYMSDSVATASPGSLLARLYDRLVLDLQAGEEAIATGNTVARNDHLTHAQDIVTELHATLKVDVWAGAPALAQIYEFALGELIQANINDDAAKVAEIRELFEPLRDAWREAAMSAERPPAAAPLIA